jgi:hypothetical protein
MNRIARAFWFQNTLNAAISFVFEDFIPMKGVIKRQTVGDDIRGINFTLLNTVKQ